MERASRESALEEEIDEEEMLLTYPENQRPLLGAELLSEQGSSGLSQSGGKLSLNEKKEVVTGGERKAPASSSIEETIEEASEANRKASASSSIEETKEETPEAKRKAPASSSVEETIKEVTETKRKALASSSVEETKEEVAKEKGKALAISDIEETEEELAEDRRKALASSSVEETKVVATKRKRKEACVWSKEASNALLEAHQRQSELKKFKSLSHNDWKAICLKVNETESTGMMKTVQQCRGHFKKKKTNSSGQETREWSIRTTFALLEAHWDQLMPKAKPGSDFDLLNDTDWQCIATAVSSVTGLNITGRQCSKRIQSLRDEYPHANSEWVYRKHVERIIAATLKSSYTSSGNFAPPSGPLI